MLSLVKPLGHVRVPKLVSLSDGEVLKCPIIKSCKRSHDSLEPSNENDILLLKAARQFDD